MDEGIDDDDDDDDEQDDDIMSLSSVWEVAFDSEYVASRNWTSWNRGNLTRRRNFTRRRNRRSYNRTFNGSRSLRNRTRAPTRPRTLAPTRDRTYVPPDIQNVRLLRIQSEECDRRRMDDVSRKTMSADCGFGYELPNVNRSIEAKKTLGRDGMWRVFFVGEQWGLEETIRKSEAGVTTKVINTNAIDNRQVQWMS
jgi:hypothetical protein